MNSSYLSVDTMTPVQNDLVSSILTIILYIYDYAPIEDIILSMRFSDAGALFIPLSILPLRDEIQPRLSAILHKMQHCDDGCDFLLRHTMILCILKMKLQRRVRDSLRHQRYDCDNTSCF